MCFPRQTSDSNKNSDNPATHNHCHASKLYMVGVFTDWKVMLQQAPENIPPWKKNKKKTVGDGCWTLCNQKNVCQWEIYSGGHSGIGLPVTWLTNDPCLSIFLKSLKWQCQAMGVFFHLSWNLSWFDRNQETHTDHCCTYLCHYLLPWVCNKVCHCSNFLFFLNIWSHICSDGGHRQDDRLGMY